MRKPNEHPYRYLGFLSDSQKLGLGSSAAVCTAMYLLLRELTGRGHADRGHGHNKHWQGGKGSGLDIASVWHGGLIHFQDGPATRATLPADLHWQVIFSGRSAGTRPYRLP